MISVLRNGIENETGIEMALVTKEAVFGFHLSTGGGLACISVRPEEHLPALHDISYLLGWLSSD